MRIFVCQKIVVFLHYPCIAQCGILEGLFFVSILLQGYTQNYWITRYLYLGSLSIYKCWDIVVPLFSSFSHGHIFYVCIQTSYMFFVRSFSWAMCLFGSKFILYFWYHFLPVCQLVRFRQCWCVL